MKNRDKEIERFIEEYKRERERNNKRNFTDLKLKEEN